MELSCERSLKELCKGENDLFGERKGCGSSKSSLFRILNYYTRGSNTYPSETIETEVETTQ